MNDPEKDRLHRVLKSFPIDVDDELFVATDTSNLPFSSFVTIGQHDADTTNGTFNHSGRGSADVDPRALAGTTFFVLVVCSFAFSRKCSLRQISSSIKQKSATNDASVSTIDASTDSKSTGRNSQLAGNADGTNIDSKLQRRRTPLDELRPVEEKCNTQKQHEIQLSTLVQVSSTEIECVVEDEDGVPDIVPESSCVVELDSQDKTIHSLEVDRVVHVVPFEDQESDAPHVLSQSSRNIVPKFTTRTASSTKTAIMTSNQRETALIAARSHLCSSSRQHDVVALHQQRRRTIAQSAMDHADKILTWTDAFRRKCEHSGIAGVDPHAIMQMGHDLFMKHEEREYNEFRDARKLEFKHRQHCVDRELSEKQHKETIEARREKIDWIGNLQDAKEKFMVESTRLENASILALLALRLVLRNIFHYRSLLMKHGFYRFATTMIFDGCAVQKKQIASTGWLSPLAGVWNYVPQPVTVNSCHVSRISGIIVFLLALSLVRTKNMMYVIGLGTIGYMVLFAESFLLSRTAVAAMFMYICFAFHWIGIEYKYMQMEKYLKRKEEEKGAPSNSDVTDAVLWLVHRSRWYAPLPWILFGLVVGALEIFDRYS